MHRYVEEGRQFMQDAIDMDDDERDSLEEEIYRIYEMGKLDVLEEEFLYIVEDSYYEDDFDSTIEESLEQAVINAEEACFNCCIFCASIIIAIIAYNVNFSFIIKTEIINIRCSYCHNLISRNSTIIT